MTRKKKTAQELVDVFTQVRADNTPAEAIWRVDVSAKDNRTGIYHEIFRTTPMRYVLADETCSALATRFKPKDGFSVAMVRF